MFELLREKFNTTISVNEDELSYCKTLFLPKKLRKRQFLLQEGDVCKYQAFVEKGLLRSYRLDEKGSEHILQFDLEGWWTADLSSYQYTFVRFGRACVKQIELAPLRYLHLLYTRFFRIQDDVEIKIAKGLIIHKNGNVVFRY